MTAVRLVAICHGMDGCRLPAKRDAAAWGDAAARGEAAASDKDHMPTGRGAGPPTAAVGPSAATATGSYLPGTSRPLAGSPAAAAPRRHPR